MIAAIVAAAGVGERMGHKPQDLSAAGRQTHPGPHPGSLRADPEIQEVTLVVHPEELDYCQEKVISPYGFKKVLRLVPGGKERQDSVYNALKALQNEDDLEIVLVHDGVRPFVTPDQVQKVILAARSHGGAVLGVPAHDTLKTVNATGEIHHTLERKEIWQIQTPQAFQAALLWRAFTEAYSRNFYGTDESSLVEQLLKPVVVVAGSPLNLKITTPEDLALAEAILPLMRRGGGGVKIGLGYDAHRFAAGRPLVLGGVAIPYHLGLLGHSDADVLSHAIGDAFLGAVGAGDLGRHFPDHDPAFRGISSLVLLENIMDMVTQGLPAGERGCRGGGEAPRRAPRPLNDRENGAHPGPPPGGREHQGHHHRKDGLYRPGRRDRRLCRGIGKKRQGAPPPGVPQELREDTYP